MNVPSWLIPVILGTLGVFFVAALVGIIIAAAKHNRRKQAEFKAAIEAMGLALQPKGDKAFAKAWSIVKPLTKGGTVTNIVFGPLGSGLALTAFKHLYMVSTGKSTHVVQHAVIAVDTPAWPKVEISRRNSLVKWVRGMMGKGKPDPAAPPPNMEESARAAFDRDWIVNADDPGFADLLLTSQVREALAADEKVSAWWFVGGKMVALRQSDLTAEVLSLGIAQIERVWDAIPPEIAGAEFTPTVAPESAADSDPDENENVTGL